MRVKPKVTKAVYHSKNHNTKLLLQLRAEDRDESSLNSMDNGRPNDSRRGDATLGEQQIFSPDPSIFTSSPPIIDALITESARKRHDTIEQCLPYLRGAPKDSPRSNSLNVPKLEREKHVAFLKAALLDAKFMGYDASRPWVVYWSLCGLSLLGEEVAIYQEK
jgi:protein farnesyltransferase subunit beta